MFSPQLKVAINHCLAHQINFAVVAMPDDSVPIFMAGTELSTFPAKGFIVNTFCNKFPQGIVIRPDYDERNVTLVNTLSATATQPPAVHGSTTDKSLYLSAVGTLIDTLAKTHGKTVISRTTCGDATSIDWTLAANRYFEAFPSTMRYLYFTTETGAWLGASPEIILSTDTATHTLATMALAGSRRQASQTSWDKKNTAEHQFVVDFITQSLSQFGLEPTIHDAETVDYGTIQHLCHRITATMPDEFDLLQLLHHLSPTPALAGTPRQEAIRQIAAIEQPNRQCYSGYIALNNDANFHAYVNIRCVHFNPTTHFCIYSGGGITAQSNPTDEWNESELKVAGLLSIITQSTRTHNDEIQ